MNIHTVIKILEHHNQWRRDKDVPPKTKMVDPKTLGVAIDEAVKLLKEIKR